MLIRNELIVNADSEREADVLMEGEQISRIESQIDPGDVAPGVEVIDADEKYVFQVSSTPMFTFICPSWVPMRS